MKCTRCNGTGHEPLSAPLADTLALFNNGARGTARDCRNASTDKLSINAFNNRLENLRKRGLLYRWRVGKEFWYAQPEKAHGKPTARSRRPNRK